MKRKIVTARDKGLYYVGGKLVKGASVSDRTKQRKSSESRTQKYAKAKVKHR